MTTLLYNHCLGKMLLKDLCDLHTQMAYQSG